MQKQMVEDFVQFTHLEKLYDSLPGMDEALVARLFGLDPEGYHLSGVAHKPLWLGSYGLGGDAPRFDPAPELRSLHPNFKRLLRARLPSGISAVLKLPPPNNRCVSVLGARHENTSLLHA